MIRIFQKHIKNIFGETQIKHLRRKIIGQTKLNFFLL